MTVPAVTPAALAAMLAPTPAATCTCRPTAVGPCHQTQYPNGPVACRARCGEPLDPGLWPVGLHVGCTEPAPIPEQLTITAPADVPPVVAAIDDAVAAGASAPWAPGEREQMLAAVAGGSRFAAPAGPKTHPLKTELIDVIRWAAATAPRSLQRAVGPSEIGVDCMRRLAYRYAGTEPVNTTADPWFSYVGTSVHESLAIAFDKQNGTLGPTDPVRYWVEQRVTFTHGGMSVSGSCDLYDAVRQTVIDHKIVGHTSLKKYVDEGPSNVYRTQIQIYAAGHAQAGRPVSEVAIAFYPRSGYLTDMHVWSEPFQPAIAEQALTRAATVRQLAAALPPGLIPASPDAAACAWCPFYRPGGSADETGCPGPQSS